MKGSAAANEANTRAVLVEPILQALGWNTTDPTQVSREYRVFDGTFLDYALLIDGKPRLFVEAKALGKKLDDNSFVSQTVNYANNEGVVWCLLTNGLAYKVYKTNEPVGMNDKLLFEVDLQDAEGGSASEVAERLQGLRPEAVSSGELDAWGEQVFADQRVRDALTALADAPPKPLIDAIEKQLGRPKLSEELLRQSLQRVLTGSRSSVGGGKVGGSGPKGGTKSGGAKAPIPAKDFPLDHHTGGRPAAIVDLFDQLDSFATNLGTDVSRRSRKFYVGYFAGKHSFFTAEVQKTRVWVYLGLDPTSGIPWNESRMRDVRNVGHYGMGDTEYSLTDASQLDEVKRLVQLAYERRR